MFIHNSLKSQKFKILMFLISEVLIFIIGGCVRDCSGILCERNGECGREREMGFWDWFWERGKFSEQR